MMFNTDDYGYYPYEDYETDFPPPKTAIISWLTLMITCAASIAIAYCYLLCRRRTENHYHPVIELKEQEEQSEQKYFTV